MDTERLLKAAQECFELEYAPYVGSASLLTGALVWFYATDISRVLKVNPVFSAVDKFVSEPEFLAHCLPSWLPTKIR